jgi:hypothetical protein
MTLEIVVLIIQLCHVGSWTAQQELSCRNSVESCIEQKRKEKQIIPGVFDMDWIKSCFHSFAKDKP